MKNPLLMTLCLAWLLATACGRSPDPAPAVTADETRSYDARGVVLELASDRQTAVIRHDEIPGYMPKMTMELNVRDPAELAGIAVGDEITFRLHVTAEAHWIDTIRRVGRTPAAAPAGSPLFVPEAASELKPGEVVPDVEFRSETGSRVRLADFRGQAVAFTFFFTRCPLPDYCPRMNANFRDAREGLLKRPDAPANWHFLCVSFDEEFDQPTVLARYANAFRGENPDRWSFVSASPAVLASLAPRLDLMVAREGGSFSHNLRTVVLDPQGRIFRQFDGNAWTPEQLADALAEAAALPVGGGNPEPVPSTDIENLFLLGDGLYSGGEPKGEAAFAQLQSLGVKTILSVDGSTPDVAAARRHGLRYVHLPLGYNGYAPDACLRLAKAGVTLPGPIFVHCHHGKHRGPAAAAVMAVSRLGWTPEQAERWLETAGTSTNYSGLFATVRGWQRPSPEVLARASADFPEVARISDLAQAMVEVDRAWDRLKSSAAAGFRAPPDHPDLVPAREAGRIVERLLESARFPAVVAVGETFVQHFNDAAAHARGLAELLESDAPKLAPVRNRYESLAKSCTECHRAFRDQPNSDHRQPE